MDAKALYYTLSTIAQTLAGAFAVLVAFVVFRLPVIEEVISVGLELLKAPERKAPYKRTAPILKRQGWTALRRVLDEYGDELASATEAPRVCQATHLAWRYRARVIVALGWALGSTVLDIALCFSALPPAPAKSSAVSVVVPAICKYRRRLAPPRKGCEGSQLTDSIARVSGKFPDRAHAALEVLTA